MARIEIQGKTVEYGSLRDYSFYINGKKIVSSCHIEHAISMRHEIIRKRKYSDIGPEIYDHDNNEWRKTDGFTKHQV